MFEWFRGLFTRPQAKPEPSYVDVGKALVTVIVNDGRQFVLEFVGEHIVRSGLGEWNDDAQDKVHRYRRQCGEMGTVYCGNGLYVPLCNVKEMQVEYREHRVEVA